MAEAWREAERIATRTNSAASLLGWVRRNRRLLAAGVPFDLASHRYLAAIYRDTSREMVIMKSGQGGASEYCISRALWCCDARAMNVLYLLPTISDISDFSQMRIGTALEASEYLAGIVVPGRDEGKRGGDRVQLKRIRDRWLIMRGAQVRTGPAGSNGPRAGASRLKTVPADLVVYDEFDEMPEGVEALAGKRLGHSVHKEQVWVSTPTYPGVGIHAKYILSNQQQWMVGCQACNQWQPLTLEHIVTEYDDLGRPFAWHGQAEGRAFCACEKCGRELDRLAEGRWVAQSHKAELVGYAFNKFATAQNNPLDVILALQTTDETKRQEVYNQDLGLPYAPRGGGLTAQVLDGATRDYGLVQTPPPDAAGAVMGVDVGLLLHVVVRAGRDAQTGERRLLHVGAVSTFEEVEHLIRRYRVRSCVVDALPETRKARELQAKMRAGVVWLCYYAGGEGPKSEDLAGWNQDQGTVTTDRTRSLDETVTRFAEAINTLPAGIRQIPDYYPHLTSMVRVIEKRRDGNPVARWVETGPDHYAHAENYCTIAGLRPAPVGVMAQGVARRKLPS